MGWSRDQNVTHSMASGLDFQSFLTTKQQWLGVLPSLFSCLSGLFSSQHVQLRKMWCWLSFLSSLSADRHWDVFNDVRDIAHFLKGWCEVSSRIYCDIFAFFFFFSILGFQNQYFIFTHFMKPFFFFVFRDRGFSHSLFFKWN